ncbi:hypothetical protein NDU88_006023 [Pleurodeles waltl]|uniref:Uncharacterized protein n=1 Tax=Pleurodeles waltl TaxID=8319 RepID=A0AAV7VLQ3_PLEWA|nr:hypothetical protein NDU88_006023 [Pleurodeles waltl]
MEVPFQKQLIPRCMTPLCLRAPGEAVEVGGCSPTPGAGAGMEVPFQKQHVRRCVTPVRLRAPGEAVEAGGCSPTPGAGAGVEVQRHSSAMSSLLRDSDAPS